MSGLITMGGFVALLFANTFDTSSILTNFTNIGLGRSGPEEATENMSSNLKGNGVFGTAEICSPRPRSKKLHVGSCVFMFELKRVPK